MKKTVLFLALVLIGLHASAQIKCTVKGRTVNRPQSTEMLLCKSYEAFESGRVIPIQDSLFEFTIEAEDPECYQLVFPDESRQGSWRSVNFCTTDGVVQMELYPMDDFLKNKIIGGRENAQMQDLVSFSRSCEDSLLSPVYALLDQIEWQDGLSPAGKALFDDLKNASGEKRNELYRLRDSMEKSGEMYTAEVRELNKRVDSIRRIVQEIGDRYDLSHRTIPVYAEIVNKLSQFESFVKYEYKGDAPALNYLEDKYKHFAKTYPQHPYTKLCADMIGSLRQVVVGGKFIDLTVPDLDGNMIRLSDQIAGKIAIIDLWASWCGPCRIGSISMKPIYDEYKDRGFTVVGVARERGDDKAMRKAIEKDGYKWTNLIELNDRAGVWLLYGINNAAGGMYLVDRDGTILAINPNATQVRAILEQKIK